MRMRRDCGRRFTGAALLAAALALAACSTQQRSAAAPPAPQFRLIATVQDLMELQIDPSADALWDSVAYIATLGGSEDRMPRTEAEWRAVRANAVTLIEAANLLCMPGRRVTALALPPGPGELSPAEVQRRIAGTHAAFVQFAHTLQDAGQRALEAIDARDPHALMDAGGQIDEACEACHVTYWYPDQDRPGG
jgi:hypothetical protein